MGMPSVSFDFAMVSVMRENFPWMILNVCEIEFASGRSKFLDICLDDLPINVTRKAMMKATQAVLKTSDTSTAMMDLSM